MDYQLLEDMKRFLIELREDRVDTYRGWVRKDGDSLIDRIAIEQERIDLQ